MTLHHGGFPIRKSTDRSLFAAPRGLSQLVASFIGSWCQGIPLVLLFAWTFHSLFDLCCSLELLEFHKQILSGSILQFKGFILFATLNHFHLAGDPFHRKVEFHLAVKLYLPIFTGKTKFLIIANLLKFCPLKSVRFYSSICFIRFSMNTWPHFFAAASCKATWPVTRQRLVIGGRSGWTRTIDLALIRRAL